MTVAEQGTVVQADKYQAGNSTEQRLNSRTIGKFQAGTMLTVTKQRTVVQADEYQSGTELTEAVQQCKKTNIRQEQQ